MGSKAVLSEDLFAIPVGEDRFCLYAPLRRAVALVNGKAVAAVAAGLANESTSLSAEVAAVLEALRAQGVLGDNAPKPPVFPEGFEFKPHEVTLFPTSRCNLRCRYCYADAGRKFIEMPWEVARAAIDLVATNAGWLGSPKFAVGFHGGGEPTAAWDFVARCVEYARSKAEEMGLEVEIHAATNGMLSQAQREFLVKHFKSLTVSLDGPKDIQDHNRPKANGDGSYDDVIETVRFLDRNKFMYSIRATITASIVSRMTEIVEHLHDACGVKDLHMEPSWYCGRCVTTQEQPPADGVFIKEFTAAVEAGRRHGIHVHYSGARLDTLTCNFCAAPSGGFSVLPEGIVTSCYEITELTDPRAAIFHYGRFDPSSGAFVFDNERIAALRRFSVEHLTYCKDCFGKWHCAGDCLAKAFQRTGTPVHQGSTRCELNRGLMAIQLRELVCPETEPQQAQEATHG